VQQGRVPHTIEVCEGLDGPPSDGHTPPLSCFDSPKTKGSVATLNAFRDRRRATVGLFQRLTQAPERVKLGLFASSFFDEAPFEVVDMLHTCLGRPSLSVGLGKIGAGTGGDILGKMEVFLRGGRAGDVNYQNLVRKVMSEAAVSYAGQLPIELVRGTIAMFREIQNRNYVLDDSFDPAATVAQAMAKDSPAVAKHFEDFVKAQMKAS
jgi:hypothetical protein